MRNTKAALQWIVSLVEEHHIEYQIVGGLAAKAYGASRELWDIDLYFPGRDFEKACQLARDHLVWGPEHYVDDNWDIEFAKFLYSGQKIEMGNSDTARRFDSERGLWVDENIDYQDDRKVEFLGVSFRAIRLEKLIEYKRKLDRDVDRIDIQEITGR